MFGRALAGRHDFLHTEWSVLLVGLENELGYLIDLLELAVFAEHFFQLFVLITIVVAIAQARSKILKGRKKTLGQSLLASSIDLAVLTQLVATWAYPVL